MSRSGICFWVLEVAELTSISKLATPLLKIETRLNMPVRASVALATSATLLPEGAHFTFGEGGRRFGFTFAFAVLAFIVLSFALPFGISRLAGWLRSRYFSQVGIFGMGIRASRSPGATALGIVRNAPSLFLCQLFVGSYLVLGLI